VTTEDRQIVLTESTKIRLTIPQAIMVVGVLASIVASGAIAWYSEKSQREEHEKNIYVHLDPKFTSEHGFPVGKWDLTNRDDAAAAAFKAFREETDAIKARQDRFDAQLSGRKPRWHP